MRIDVLHLSSVLSEYKKFLNSILFVFKLLLTWNCFTSFEDKIHIVSKEISVVLPVAFYFQHILCNTYNNFRWPWMLLHIFIFILNF